MGAVEKAGVTKVGRLIYRLDAKEFAHPSCSDDSISQCEAWLRGSRFPSTNGNQGKFVMWNSTSLYSFFLLITLSVGAVNLSPNAETVTRQQNFDRDPGWEAYNNRITPKHVPTVKQDFGYSLTNCAGGAVGEIGGQVWRSTQPASYAKKIASLSLEGQLEMSGTFSLRETEGSSGCFFGWFTAGQPGSGRPVSSLGWYLDAESSGARMFAGILTRTNRTHLLWETDFQIGKKNPPIKADGRPRRWKITFDPSHAEGRGKLTLQLDDKPPVTTVLPPGFRAEGAEFDRFGLMNLHKGGNPLTIYLDDISVNGSPENFRSDPGWEANGNRRTYRDTIVTGAHNFGYSRTNHTGGDEGELGGIFWRTENPFGYYADRVGPLSLDNSLKAQGKVAFTVGAMDAGMFLGWFNSRSKDLPETEFRNVVGVYIEGPSRIGHYFRPICATASGQVGDPKQGPVILPNGKSRNWSLHYDPNAADGAGVMTVTLDEETFEYQLPDGFRKAGAKFDRFGVFTARAGGSHVKLYFDELRYTSARNKDD